MSIDDHEPERPVIDVPEHIAYLATTDGRVFVDVDAWVTTMHNDVHDGEALTTLTLGADFYKGQHVTLIGMHQIVDDVRLALELPALFPEEEVPDVTSAPSDESHALDEVIDLETMFNRPSFGG